MLPGVKREQIRGNYCLMGTISGSDDEKVPEMNSDDGSHSTVDALNAYIKSYT